MKLQMSFGENLVNLRKQKGWSQDDLAENLNLSRQAISKWENDTSKPDIDNVMKISKLFSVTIDDLVNNDVVKDKAVTLNVKKEEKKERLVIIVKSMIIAIILLYVINVIYKFASLLIIVNGIQKYANLSNYHYVITTYDENGLVEKEECWFKDGVSKTIAQKFDSDNLVQNIGIELDYKNNLCSIEDYILNSNNKIYIEDFENFYKKYSYGKNIYYIFPIEIQSKNIKQKLLEIFLPNLLSFENNDDYIKINTTNKNLLLDKHTLLPKILIINENSTSVKYYSYKIELN